MKRIKYVLDILFFIVMAGVGLAIGMILYLCEYYPERSAYRTDP